jgi:hypothetical protein
MMNSILCLRGRRLATFSLTGLVAAIGLSLTAQAQTLGSLVRVTGSDPFTACTADNVHRQQTVFGSTLYPDTAIEPWLAVDPTDASRLLVGHQQDRWDDGGARGLVGVLSNDAGSSWKDSIPQDVTKCTGGDFIRASDPWTAFALDGTAFFFSLVLDPAKPTTPFGARHGGMLVSRSTDHVATWSAPITLIKNNSPHVLNDKNSITADPTKNGLVYAVWDQLSVFPPTDQGDSLLAQGEGIPLARKLINSTAGASAVCVPATKPPCRGGAPFFKFNFTGPSLLALSTDNGQTWGPATAIYSPGVNAQTIDNLVQVLPKGDVLDFFTAINVAPVGVGIGFVRSTNKGVSWSTPSFATDIQVVGVVSPDAGEPVRDASILYSVAVNPLSGAIYLAWQDDRFSTPPNPAINCTTPTGTIPVDSIAFSQSLDGGLTWSTPIRINATPANANPCRQQAFIPAVVASGDGNFVVVTYYDFRNDTNTPAGFEATDYFAIFCDTTTNCSKPASWGNELRVTTSSFNILDAPVAGGHFLGDYMGLAASGPSTTYPVFGIATGKNTTAEFTRAIFDSKVRVLE